MSVVATQQRPLADTARQVRDRVRQLMQYELDRFPEREKLIRIVEILTMDSRREGLILFKSIVEEIIKEHVKLHEGSSSYMDLYFEGKLSAYRELKQLLFDEIGNV